MVKNAMSELLQRFAVVARSSVETESSKHPKNATMVLQTAMSFPTPAEPTANLLLVVMVFGMPGRDVTMEPATRTQPTNAELTVKFPVAVTELSTPVSNVMMETHLTAMVALQAANPTVATVVLNRVNNVMTVLRTITPDPELAEPTADCPFVETRPPTLEKSATMVHRICLDPTLAVPTAPFPNAVMESSTICTGKFVTKPPETHGQPSMAVHQSAPPTFHANPFGSMSPLTQQQSFPNKQAPSGTKVLALLHLALKMLITSSSQLHNQSLLAN